jgi:hypothetical protein
MNTNIKKGRIRITLILLAASILGVLFLFVKNQHQKTLHTKPEPWMTVFVHGSFGSLLGFLSVPTVLSGSVQGTQYKDVNKRLRRNPLFFKGQPILQKGLIRFEPTFDIKATGGRPYTAYPIAKAYETILNEVRPDQEKNYFYTFGWSGLITQSRRQQEAIRFYNALNEELEKFHNLGIFPKVRLIAHSHGGNLCLNLAAIKTVLNVTSIDEIDKLSSNPDEAATLTSIFSIIKNLPSYQTALRQEKQKRYDYAPKNKNIKIDEFIAIATPIQPETESLFASPVFNTIYHLYSDEDYVQRSDWVSSRKAYSAQRISEDVILRSFDGKQSRITQVQVMIEQSELDPNKSKIKETSIWSEFLSGEQPFKRSSKNPSHKEFWFASWTPENAEFVSFLLPLPVVIFMPFIINSLRENPELKDVDINIKPTEKHIKLLVYQHEDIYPKIKARLPISILSQIKLQFEHWRPIQSSSHEDDFELIQNSLR